MVRRVQYYTGYTVPTTFGAPKWWPEFRDGTVGGDCTFYIVQSRFYYKRINSSPLDNLSAKDQSARLA